MTDQQKIQIGLEFLKLYHKERDTSKPLSIENERMMREYSFKNGYSVSFLQDCKELYLNSIVNR